MDASRLPYELQFKYLLDLSTEEVLSYCLSSRSTWEIWLTRVFWERKAQKDFGLPLDHVEGSSPFHQYREFERLERDEPTLLLILAINEKSIDQIPRYFRKAHLSLSKNRPLLSLILNQLDEEGSMDLKKLLLDLIQEESSDLSSEVLLRSPLREDPESSLELKVS